MEYKIEVCKDPMSGKEITDYCEEHNARFLQIHNVPLHPHGQHWHYFEVQPKKADTKKKKK